MESTPSPTWDTITNDVAIVARASSLSHRLLAGAGLGSVEAPRLEPGVEVATLSHCLGQDGELLLAGLSDGGAALTCAPVGTQIDIRMEITKEAPETAVRILACALHILGTLEWLPAATVEAYLAEGGLHPRVAELAASENGRLGIVHTERLLLHDSTGVTPIGLAALTARLGAPHDAPSKLLPFPSDEQEWDACDIVAGLSQHTLSGLFEAVLDGWAGGIALSVHEQEVCPHLWDEVVCVDIDRSGLTLMRVFSDGTLAMLFPFTEPATTVAELSDRVADLVERSADRLRLPRY